MNDRDSRRRDKRSVARQLLATALEMVPAEIEDDAAIGRLNNWDSLAHMRLIMALEEHMGIQLAPDVVVAISDLSDIASILEEGENSSQP